MNLENSYLEQVYAAVLGKVIGVYVGRPFEGWNKEHIEKKFGEIDRYVHEEQDFRDPNGVPLIVPDDDITGTFTFIRALEDSGDYANTSAEFFGDTWLNYLVENKTILWWGGMGHSTEHTAYLRLKNGVKAPQSGSMALNSKVVSEQIGAQIFIDAFGMVAPGNPQLAVSMAEKAAQVSHDGEAVYAAKVVAAMVSAAFTEKDMEKLLDIGVSFIPGDSIIAEVHRDVRVWSKEDGDWRLTYSKIDEKYGYHRYGGNCHVIPNHALMVMAWSYAPDNFHLSQNIINTAGWDTDCNAANVGSVMGLIVGLEGINCHYDFQGPTADRLLMPTAEGTEGNTDCLIIARRVEAIGRKIMNWNEPAIIKDKAWHYFEMPGALHGYMPETSDFNCRGTCQLENVAGHSALGSRSMKMTYCIDKSRKARISTPLSSEGEPQLKVYAPMGCPKIYPGNTVTVSGIAGEILNAATARLFVRAAGTGELYYSEAAQLAVRQALQLSFTVPTLPQGTVLDFGIEISADAMAQGEVFVDAITITGNHDVKFPYEIFQGKFWEGTSRIDGWVYDINIGRGQFSDDDEVQTQFGKNEGRGEVICGSTSWSDYCFEARIKIHLATKAGIVARYRGKQRYLCVEIEGNTARLVQRNYGDKVLAEVDLSSLGISWQQGTLYAMQIRCKGPDITVMLEGQEILTGIDHTLNCGGAGFMFEDGIMGVRDIRCYGLVS